MAVALTALLAIFNAVAYGAAVFSFRTSLRQARGATWWFVVGFGFVASVVVLRGLYWDVALPLFRWLAPDLAMSWRDLTSGRVVNILFHVLNAVAILSVLRCRQMLIPEEERHLWPIWRAWLHPNTRDLFWWWRDVR